MRRGADEEKRGPVCASVRPAWIRRAVRGGGALALPQGRVRTAVHRGAAVSTGSDEGRCFSPCSGRACVRPSVASAGRDFQPPAFTDDRCTHDMFVSSFPTLHPALRVLCASGPAGGLVVSGRRRAAAPPFSSRPDRTPARALQFRSHCSRVKSCSRSGWHTDRRRAAQRRPQPAVRRYRSDASPGPSPVRAGPSPRIGRSLASPPLVSPHCETGSAASARPLLFRSGRTAAVPEPPRRVSLGACTPRTDPYVQRNCR